MEKIQKQQGEITYNILKEFNAYLQSLIIPNYSIYYKNGGSLVDIITVIPKDNNKIEKKIYFSETKILDKYSDKIEIDFHLIPQYNEPLGSYVPSGFERYVPKITAS